MKRAAITAAALLGAWLALYAASAWQRWYWARPVDPAKVELMRKAAEEHAAK